MRPGGVVGGELCRDGGNDDQEEWGPHNDNNGGSESTVLA